MKDLTLPTPALPPISDFQLIEAAVSAGLHDEIWFGEDTPPGYEDCMPKLRAFAKAILSTNHEDGGRAATSELEQMRERKDAAYLERNQVVAALAKCFPSGVARTAIEGWSEDWHGCVYIDLPTGQASWHFHDSHAYLFDGLPPYTDTWDGHDTPEKYARLAKLAPVALGGEKGEAVDRGELLQLAWWHGAQACNLPDHAPEPKARHKRTAEILRALFAGHFQDAQRGSKT